MVATDQVEASSGGKIYWQDFTTDRIYRANLDGTDVEDLGLDISSGNHISLDPQCGKIYQKKHNGQTRSIFRANQDGTGEEDLNLDFYSLSNIGRFTLNSQGGKIYWPRPQTYEAVNGFHRAALDGKNEEFLRTTSTQTASSSTHFAIDPLGRNIFWVPNGKPTIQRANIDGTGEEDLGPQILFLV